MLCLQRWGRPSQHILSRSFEPAWTTPLGRRPRRLEIAHPPFSLRINGRRPRLPEAAGAEIAVQDRRGRLVQLDSWSPRAARHPAVPHWLLPQHLLLQLFEMPLGKPPAVLKVTGARVPAANPPCEALLIDLPATAKDKQVEEA